MFDMFNNNFLRHPQYPDHPCYRKVISYGFFKCLKKSNRSVAEGEFSQMIDAIKNNKIFYLENFIEIYQVLMRNRKQGYLVVGPKDGCFPLVQDPNPRGEHRGIANKTRESGFKVAIQKLQKNRSQIFELLDKHDEWTPELEAELARWFEYTTKKSDANDSNFGGGMRKTANH